MSDSPHRTHCTCPPPGALLSAIPPQAAELLDFWLFLYATSSGRVADEIGSKAAVLLGCGDAADKFPVYRAKASWNCSSRYPLGVAVPMRMLPGTIFSSSSSLAICLGVIGFPR